MPWQNIVGLKKGLEREVKKEEEEKEEQQIKGASSPFQAFAFEPSPSTVPVAPPTGASLALLGSFRRRAPAQALVHQFSECDHSHLDCQMSPGCLTRSQSQGTVARACQGICGAADPCPIRAVIL